MALVNRYITTTGTTASGNSEANAWSPYTDATHGFQSAAIKATTTSEIAAMAAGDIYCINVKCGAYSTSAAFALVAAHGTTSYLKPIWLRGYKTTPGDLDYLVYGGPSQTFPSGSSEIPTFTNNTKFGVDVSSPINNVIITGFDVTGSQGSSLAYIHGTSLIAGCKVTNTISNASGGAIGFQASSYVISNRAICSGTTIGATYGAIQGANFGYIIGNYIDAGYLCGIGGANAGLVILNNVIKGSVNSANGISPGVTAANLTIIGNTIYGFTHGTYGIGINLGSASASGAGISIVMNNKIMDCRLRINANTTGGGYDIIEINNLYRSSGTNVPGFMPSQFNNSTTSSGLAFDFISASGGDFRPVILGGSGLNDSMFLGAVGALQLPPRAGIGIPRYLSRG